MSRIKQMFESMAEKKEKALIGYLTFGSPSNDATPKIVLEMEKKGLDLIEIGIPYSDPVADGEVIRIAGEKALFQGTKVRDVFQGIKTIRENSDMPIVILTYFNTAFSFGVDRFFSFMKENGADGVIIPDLPMEELDEIVAAAEENSVDIIPLVTRTSGDRIKEIVSDASGFVYCVSILGVTGVRESIDDDLTEYMESVRNHTDLPRAIGFGISNGETAKRFKDISEGIIVGSAFVKETIEDVDLDTMIKKILTKTEEIKKAINSN